MKPQFVAVAAFGILAFCFRAEAASLTVSPVLVDVMTRGDAATAITVANAGDASVDVQSRAVRWNDKGGKDELEPTDDLAISPPIVRIEPGHEQVIRIIRLTHRPVTGEESYRVLVDQLPAAPRRSAVNVSLIVRQSIPVFFRSPDATEAALGFSFVRAGDKMVLRGENLGELHHKVTQLVIKDARGAVVYKRAGLLGYVLGRSSFDWPLPPAASKPGRKTIVAQTEQGVISLTAAAP